MFLDLGKKSLDLCKDHCLNIFSNRQIFKLNKNCTDSSLKPSAAIARKLFGVELKFVELRADASKQTVKKFERNPE